MATANSTSWRRKLRFSVRSLLVLVLVIGGWLGWTVRNARIQREAVAAIRLAGGTVTYHWDKRHATECVTFCEAMVAKVVGQAVGGRLLRACRGCGAHLECEEGRRALDSHKTARALTHVAALDQLENIALSGEFCQGR